MLESAGLLEDALREYSELEAACLDSLQASMMLSRVCGAAHHHNSRDEAANLGLLETCKSPCRHAAAVCACMPLCCPI